MRRIRFLFPLLLLPIFISAQEICIDIVPTGGHDIVLFPSGLEHTYLIGETRNGRFYDSNSGLEVIEGFLQPDLLSSSATLVDSVWPGDANADGIADMYDLLPIGLGFGTTGPMRPAASLAWTAQAAPPWVNSLISGSNFNHIDVDGNGSINADDTLGIIQNYGLSHNKWDASHENGLPLFAVFEEDSLMIGDTARIQIHLGTDTLPVQQIYGLAFSLAFDTSLVDLSSLKTSFQSSWMGTENVDLLSLAHLNGNNESVDIAITRTDQQNSSGSGPIAQVSIIMIDDLARRSVVEAIFQIDILGVQGITADQSDLSFSAGGDSLVLSSSSTHIGPSWTDDIQVYPNPAQDFFEVSLGALSATSVTLYHISGQKVWQQNGRFHNMRIPVSRLARGAYFLMIETEKGIARKRIMLESSTE